MFRQDVRFRMLGGWLPRVLWLFCLLMALALHRALQ
jgi:hypothetical protein